MESPEISELDRLKVQVAWFKFQRAKDAFDAEVMRVSSAYSMTQADSFDIDTGAITRGKALHAIP